MVRNPTPLPPIEYLHSIYEYDPNLGQLFTKEAQGRRPAILRTVFIEGKHYLRIRILGKTYYAHRLAWKLHYDEEPPFRVLQRDKNPLNLNIDNLYSPDEG